MRFCVRSLRSAETELSLEFMQALQLDNQHMGKKKSGAGASTANDNEAKDAPQEEPSLLGEIAHCMSVGLCHRAPYLV